MATARNHFAITKSDATVILCDAVFVGGAGDIVILDKDGTSATYTVPANTILPITATKVMSTGTTATNIVGLLY